MGSSLDIKVSDRSMTDDFLLDARTFTPKLLDRELAVFAEYNEDGSLGRNSYRYSDLEVGMWTMIDRNICDGLVRQYARLSRDENPLHLDERFAEGTIFKERIAHGILLAGEISAILGMVLPGTGTIYSNLKMDFLAPVPVNSKVETYSFITELKPEKRIINMKSYVILPEHKEKVVLSVDNVLMLDPNQG